MSPKDLISTVMLLTDGIAKYVGYVALTLIALSLYPPLSFIPKLVMVFVMTH